MFIQHNISALGAYRNMQMHQNVAGKSLRRLSSGYRINSAADDPAGLAISERMRGQIRGLKQASRNAQDMIHMLQTADGGIAEGREILQRMRELAVMAGGGTYRDEDRMQLSYEYEALKAELDRISGSTHYNGQKLLDGSAGGVKGLDALKQVGLDSIEVTGEVSGYGSLSLSMNPDGTGNATFLLDGKNYTAKIAAKVDQAAFDLGDGREVILRFGATALETGRITGIHLDGPGSAKYGHSTGTNQNSGIPAQIGANGGADNVIRTPIGSTDSASLGAASGKGTVANSSINTAEDARAAIDIVEKAISQLSSQGAGIGARINALYYTIHGLDTMAENLTAAESVIRDLDMAEEMMTFTRATVLAQVAQAITAQAMNAPKSILELLKSL